MIKVNQNVWVKSCINTDVNTYVRTKAKKYFEKKNEIDGSMFGKAKKNVRWWIY